MTTPLLSTHPRRSYESINGNLPEGDSIDENGLAQQRRGPSITPTKTISIVTGANSGIGYETATNLIRAGHHVILACRNKHAGELAAAQITRDCIVADSYATCIHLDLSDLSTVTSFTQRLLQYDPSIQTSGIHNLICNAGIGWGTKTVHREVTIDGNESFFQINYLGHFLLSIELMALLIQGAKNKTTKSRIVQVSSSLHDPNGRGNRKTPVILDFKDINATSESPFQPKSAYCRSKAYQIMLTYSLHKKIRELNVPIVCSCLSPGFIPSTGLVRNSGRMGIFFLRYCLDGVFKCCCNVTRTVKDGGECVYLVTVLKEGSASEGGLYFEYNRSKELCCKDSSLDSYDDAKQKELWEVSCNMVGVESDWMERL